LNNSGPANPAQGPGTTDDFVTVAKVAKPQGRKGEVAAALLTDFPELFATRKRLFALDAGGHRRELELEDHWPHKGRIILKFKGIDSISDAETLAGQEIQIPRSERAALEGSAVYLSDLIGCAVYDAGRQVGRIEDVQFGAGEAPLLVVKGAKEYLIPFAGEYLEKLLPEQKRIEMKLPQGMLELDAPVTAEERQRQRSK
jgi:16S rRNA processing protein RimM